MDTVELVAVRTRALLNDQTDQVFHTDLLLEFINDAFEEIQEELALRNISAVREISATVPILASTPGQVISRTQIPDLFFPLSLQEFPTGSSEDPIDMTRIDWDSEIDPSDRILYWSWREGQIKIPVVTQATSVLVKYNKLSIPLDNDDDITLIGTKRFLARKTAYLAAGPVGGRWELVEFLGAETSASKDLFLSNSVRQLQKFGTRRKPFRRQYAR